jgi:hypothetical protein
VVSDDDGAGFCSLLEAGGKIGRLPGYRLLFCGAFADKPSVLRRAILPDSDDGS